MSKKNTVLVGGILIIAGGLILRDLYKKGKLKRVENYLEPLLTKGKEIFKQQLEKVTSKSEEGSTPKMNSVTN